MDDSAPTHIEYAAGKEQHVTCTELHRSVTPGAEPLSSWKEIIGNGKVSPHTRRRYHFNYYLNYFLERWGSAAGKRVVKVDQPPSAKWRLNSTSTGITVSILLFAMWYIYTFLLGFLPRGAPLVLKDGVGRLPALGWNSWNAYHCDITESQFITAAQKVVDLGLKVGIHYFANFQLLTFQDAGYGYVNIDDCWQVKDYRDNITNRLIPDPTRFPDGIKGTADKIHGLGLKIGIYSSAGTLTCAGYQASLGYESIDAATWAEWEIDYLKYDNCNVPQNWTDACSGCVPESRDDLVNGTCTNPNGMCSAGYDYSKSLTARRFAIMRDALLAQPRTLLYSLCEWGQAGVQQWGNRTGSSWRMSGDIDPSWARVLEILNENTFYLNNYDFWGHGDADMLEVGNGLSIEESRTHFAIWAAMKSPLLIGTDLSRIASDQLNVLKNKDLLAFNQDPVYGKPAKPYKWGTNPDWTFNASFPAEYWSGASSKGTLVLLFNPYSDTRVKSANFSEIPELQGQTGYQLKDVWSGNDLGCVKDGMSVNVTGHDTAAFLVTGPCGQSSIGKRMVRGLRFVGDW